MADGARVGCVLCLRLGYEDTPAEIHHVRRRILREPELNGSVAAICPHHHRNSNEAVHVMGRKAFERYFGVTEDELVADTERLIRELRRRNVAWAGH